MDLKPLVRHHTIPSLLTIGNANEAAIKAPKDQMI